jgi:hypothetical protein
MKHKILAAAFSALCFSSTALANGYWDYREVCDYETVEVEYPYVSCFYSGIATGSTAGIYVSDQVTSLDSKPIGQNCDQFKQYHGSKRVQLPNGSYATVWLSGVIFLAQQSNEVFIRTETQVVEGSCRTERVWVPLCDGCQIP